MMPSGPPEFIPPFIPVTGMKCSYGKISSPLTEISVGKTEISGTERARLSYEHIENFTKDLEVRRDLGNRASPVNRAHMKRPLIIPYKALNNLVPSYVRDTLIYLTFHETRQLRSSTKNLLSIPHFNLRTHSARSSSVAAPTIWNALPSDIKNSSSVSVFKNRLKTFLS